MTLLIRGGLIVDPLQGLEKKADLLLERGKVTDLGKLQARKSWDVIDARGCVVAPGFVDMHVHLREPGREDKETIASGARAAAAGGFTAVMCMPNTDPVNDCEAVTRFILERARRANLVRVYPAGAITKGSRGKELAEIGEMVRAGAVAITDDGHPVENDQIMRRALEYSRIFDVPVVDHCENLELAAGGCMNEGSVSTRLGLPGMSRAAEETDVARDVLLSRVTGGRVHIAHLSTRGSLQLVRQAKQEGLEVTCEVTPHHFTLTEQDIGEYDTHCKMAPPLREPVDVEALLEGLADGTVDCIATDHAPHTSLEKDTSFEDAANGIIGMESAIPLAWEFLARRRGLPVRRLVELFSVQPNRILRLPGGTLQPGSPADVTVLDPDRPVTIDVGSWKSKSRNSPFHGWELHGLPVLTVVRGRVVFRRNRGAS